MIFKWHDIELRWRESLSSANFRNQAVLTSLFFVFCEQVSVSFIKAFELRQGLLIHDFILHFFVPRNLSVFIFGLTYPVIAITIILTIPYPDRFIKGFQAFSLLLLARVCAIYAVPLEPPLGMVLLRDPVGDFFLKDQFIITKDLFFSGHTSTLFLMLFIARQMWWKYFVFLACISVPLMLMMQHVHYSIDVFVAPFAAYTIYTLVNHIHRKSKYGIQQEYELATSH